MRDRNGRHDATTGNRPARLRAGVAAGLVAAVLSLGIGLAVLGAFAATATVAAGGLGLAYGACQRVEANLASDLGVSVAALRAIDPAGLPDRVTARQPLGALTATGARHAAESATAYANCRQVFGELAAADNPSAVR